MIIPRSLLSLFHFTRKITKTSLLSFFIFSCIKYNSAVQVRATVGYIIITIVLRVHYFSYLFLKKKREKKTTG